MVSPEAPAPSDEGDAPQRLSLFDQCQILAALHWRSAPQFYQRGSRAGHAMPGQRWSGTTVARAFGVSQFTITRINTCLAAWPPRYQKLVTEFRELGEKEFMRVYYTPELRNRLVEARRPK